MSGSRGVRAFGTLIALALVSLGLMAGGCGREELPRLQLDTRPVLNFGFLPYSDEEHMRGLYSAAGLYLQERLGIPVNFVLARDYEAVGELMGSHLVDLAWFTPASYVMVGRGIGARAICRPFRRGGDTYKTIVIVRADSTAHTLKDLAGKRFAYVDRHSTSGFVLPNQMLARQGVTNPLDFFSEVEFTYSHARSMRGLLDGQFDAAAVYEGAPEELAGKGGPVPIRIIAQGPSVPNDPIAVRPGLDEGLVRKITDLLLGMDRAPEGKSAIRALYKLERISRFVPARDEEYRW